MQAALEALERDGVGGVAVEPIARRLGVTKGSFYHHFSDRSELLAAAVGAWEAASVAGPIEALQGLPPRERLTGLFGKAGGKPPTVFARMLDAHDVPAVAQAVARAAHARIDFMAGAFAELGLTPARARRQATLAYAAYVGLVHLRRDAPDLVDDRLMRHLAETLVPGGS